MDVLIALGTSAAWGYGFALIFAGYSEAETNQPNYHMMVMEHAHNFEISSVLLTVILLGKMIETISKKRTVDRLTKLASLKVTQANLIEPNIKQKKGIEPISLDAKSRVVGVELLQVGDFVKVMPGAGVPVDGIVVFGSGICDESMLTGESKPVNKEISASVYGGSILQVGSLIIKVTKTSENSSLSQIMKLVESAQNAKAPI